MNNDERQELVLALPWKHLSVIHRPKSSMHRLLNVVAKGQETYSALSVSQYSDCRCQGNSIRSSRRPDLDANIIYLLPGLPLQIFSKVFDVELILPQIFDLLKRYRPVRPLQVSILVCNPLLCRHWGFRPPITRLAVPLYHTQTLPSTLKTFLDRLSSQSDFIVLPVIPSAILLLLTPDLHLRPHSVPLAMPSYR